MANALEEAVEAAYRVVAGGGVILYPTDTIWGLGCDGRNREAVRRIFRIKQRPEAKSLILLVDGLAMLEQYTQPMTPAVAEQLQRAKVPTTVIYPVAHGLAPEAVAAEGSVAIRIVHQPFCQALLARMGGPLVSTSANASGTPYQAPPLIPREIVEAVDYAVPWALDTAHGGKASRIIRIDARGAIQVLRE